MEKELTIDEIKKLTTSMLLAFDDVCRKNQITYSICYGTLLGAVRHAGFIPWDDDIDVAMTRDNYQKLVKTLNDGYLSDDRKYKLYSLQSDNQYSAPLAKLVDTSTILLQYGHAEKTVLGVYMDVFIFDKVPENNIRRTKCYAAFDRLQKIWTASEMKPLTVEKNCVKVFIKRILNLGMARIIAKWIDQFARKINRKNTESHLIGNLLYCAYGRENETFPYEQFTDVSDISFEGHPVSAFKNYDLVLKRFYHDYMQLPPIEKRVPHHDFIATWK